MVRNRKRDTKQLTDVELEMMRIIWSIGPCSVHQMLDTLPTERQLAYTSVSTMVRILEQKEFVRSIKDGRGHLYQALVSEADYQATSMNHLIKNVFHGEPSQLVQHLLSSQGLTEQDLLRIQALLNSQRQK